MPGKLGVYICTGCSIGDSIDAAKLAKVATGECHAAVCRTHAALCGAEGCAQIRQDLAEGAVDTVVVAACSPRFKAESFSFNHGSVVERVNLREHVAWCHKPQDEDTQMLAEDYLRMGVARALKTEPLKPLADDISKALLVVGGGVTGITAAMEAAQAGYSVFLVEKEERLGGRAALVKSHFPTEPPYTSLAADGIQASVEAVLYHPRIRVFSPAQIVKIEGQPGMFDVTLESWLGMEPSLCVFRPTCGGAMALEHNGDLYSCDHYVYPENKLGNILEQPLAALVNSVQQRTFGLDKRDSLPRYCRDCDVRFACNGECPKHRFILPPDGEPGLNYLCAGYKRFFHHVDPYMKFMANELRHQRPPANIMQWIRQQEHSAALATGVQS